MERFFAKLASSTSRLAGSPYAFITNTMLIVIWALSGPIFHYSETWQLVVNTATTIITFLMVFLIQNAQNRDSQSIQTKLNELIRASDALNDYIGIEDMTCDEIETLHTPQKKLNRKLAKALARDKTKAPPRTI